MNTYTLPFCVIHFHSRRTWNQHNIKAHVDDPWCQCLNLHCYGIVAGVAVDFYPMYGNQYIVGIKRGSFPSGNVSSERGITGDIVAQIITIILRMEETVVGPETFQSGFLRNSFGFLRSVQKK